MNIRHFDTIEYLPQIKHDGHWITMSNDCGIAASFSSVHNALKWMSEQKLAHDNDYDKSLFRIATSRRIVASVKPGKQKKNTASVLGTSLRMSLKSRNDTLPKCWR